MEQKNSARVQNLSHFDCKSDQKHGDTPRSTTNIQDVYSIPFRMKFAHSKCWFRLRSTQTLARILDDVLCFRYAAPQETGR
jgi:hypothetical protein